MVLTALKFISLCSYKTVNCNSRTQFAACQLNPFVTYYPLRLTSKNLKHFFQTLSDVKVSHVWRLVVKNLPNLHLPFLINARGNYVLNCSSFLFWKRNL